MRTEPSSHCGKRTLVLALLALFGASQGSAIDLVVYNNNNAGAGSLRQAVNDNHALGGGHTIVFSNAVTGTITLSSELVISTNVTIVGPGPNVLTISGNDSSRIFNIPSGIAIISGLTIANGRANLGGGIHNLGTLHLSNCLFRANVSSGSGGAVASIGNLTASRCAFVSNNASAYGGALSLEGSAVVNHSTIVGNSGVSEGGGINNYGRLTLTACTVVSNRLSGVASRGGGIYGSATVRNTIIAGNTAAFGKDVYDDDAFVSEGYNLIGETNGSGGWGAVGDQLGTAASPLAPRLFPLGLYAGSTPTMPPLSGSLAVDQGKSFGSTLDQHGRPRTHDQAGVVNATLGDGTDIGAAETGPAITRLVTTTNDAGAGSLRQAIMDSWLSENAAVSFAPNVTGTITLTSGELLVGTTVQIAGPGPQELTISGNKSSRVLNVLGGAATISGLTIANGEAYPIGGPPRDGGGIFALGALTLSNCVFAGNNASYGGAVSSSFNLIVDRCAFVNNSAVAGGALTVSVLSMLKNSTVVSNAACSGGGILSFDGLTVSACTIVNNTSVRDCDGGGIYALRPVAVRNSIIAGNRALNDGYGDDVYGEFVSQGYNFVGKTNYSTGWGVIGDQLGSEAAPINPLLAPPGNYGGPTPCMVPLSGSPVIDQGKNFVGTVDQRGRARTHDHQFIPNATGGDGTDIGAVEIGLPITLLVRTTNDSGAGTLRQAILEASPTENDSIVFAPHVTNTITLTSGPLSISKSVEIAGPGANVLRLSGNKASRVFNLSGGSTIVYGLTIANGWSGNAYGGGVLVDGGVHIIVGCQIVSNATPVSWSGGGICVRGNADLNLVGSSVIHNVAGVSGGGIAQIESASLDIYNSTIASNRTTWPYDGIIFPYGGGISMITEAAGATLVENSTISGNVSTYVAGGIGNGFFTSGTAQIRNSIIAGNTAIGNGPDVLGPFISDGYNLIGDPSGSTGFTNATDQLNVNPLLGPLADYGGPMATMALRTGSPAIDQGKNFGSIVDQRVFPRTLDDPSVPNASGGDGTDIGAFEVDPRFRIIDLRRAGNDVALSLMTVLGRNYRAEYTNNLAAGSWTTFTNNAPGNGWLLWVTNSGGANQPRRFYRGQLLP